MKTLAINPTALDLFELFEGKKQITSSTDGVTATIKIDGAICDSSFYSELEFEFSKYASVAGIVLEVNSPGGVTDGLFDCVRSLKATYGSKTIARAKGMACSAGYALLTIGKRIEVSDTSMVGSIGVIGALLDVTKLDASMGIKYHVVASSEQKKSAHQHAEITDEAIKDQQEIIDDIANVFFSLVDSTRGIDSRALNAKVVVGRKAISVGLADAIIGEKQVMNLEEVKGALRALAEGDGSDEEKAEAKRCLAAMETEEPKAEVKEEEKEEPKEDEKMAALTSQLASLQASVAKLASKPNRVMQTNASIGVQPSVAPVAAPAFKSEQDVRLDIICGLYKPPAVQNVGNLQMFSVLGVKK